MPNISSDKFNRNAVLSHLSRGDLGLLRPHLEAVDLPVRTQLESSDKRIDEIYFVESGLASVVANGSSQRSIEVGIIGREGMTGLSVLMGTDRSPNETFMQIGGAGQRISAATLRKGMALSDTLRRCLLRHGHAFVVQMADTATANGRNKIEERLARWLLMAHDRLDTDEVPLTHEFLAMMLAVRRPGVTVALNLLEKVGLIQVGRGAIFIVDREGLKEKANGAYGAPEAEYRRLFG